jgi:hypothetical protein
VSVYTRPLTTPPVSPRLAGICAYCADPATHQVYAYDDIGQIIAAAYCCDEPTHWDWLVESVERFMWENSGA